MLIKSNLFTSALLILASASQVFAQNVTCANAGTVVEFDFTGTEQVFVVPTPVAGGIISNIHIEAFGAQGADGQSVPVTAGKGGSVGGLGGLGGFVEGDLAVAPGSSLSVFVGGQGSTPNGGFNGGGNGGTENAGGGGGASDVRVGSSLPDARVVIAGGGGGGGKAGCEANTVVGGNGGAGGGGTGQDGANAPTSNGVAGGGKGGSSLSAGGAGIGCAGFLGQPGTLASALVGGNGGAGQSCCCITANSKPGGGGGGGGAIPGSGGGGGSAGTVGCLGNDKGAGGGGAGGTSSTSLANSVVTPGVQVGNGKVRLCFTSIAPTATPTATATVTPTATNTPTSTPTLIPTLTPTPSETVGTTSGGLRYELLASSFGKGDFASPVIRVLKEGSSVGLRSCFNFKKIKRGYSRLTTSLRNSANKIISKRTLTTKKPCLELELAQMGDFALKFVQSARGKKSLRSKATQFRIK